MFSQACETPSADLDLLDVQMWKLYWTEMERRIGSAFARSDARARAMSYLAGLVSPAERKTSWQLAEISGAPNPYGFQHFIVDPMSRTIFKPVFRGVPLVTLPKCLTLSHSALLASKKEYRSPIPNKGRRDSDNRVTDVAAPCCRTGNSVQSLAAPRAGCSSQTDTPPRISRCARGAP
jgi:hypothetical protein